MESNNDPVRYIIDRLRDALGSVGLAAGVRVHEVYRAEYAQLQKRRELGPRVGCLVLELSTDVLILISLVPPPFHERLVLWLPNQAGREDAIECIFRRSLPMDSEREVFLIESAFVRIWCEAEEVSRRGCEDRAANVAI